MYEAQTLIEQLKPGGDDAAVLTILCRRADDTDHVVAGSLIVGPSDIATNSWVAFAAGQAHRQEAEQARACDHDLYTRPEFVWRHGPWTLVRCLLSTDSLASQLTDAVHLGRLSIVADGQSFETSVSLEPARDRVASPGVVYEVGGLMGVAA